MHDELTNEFSKGSIAHIRVVLKDYDLSDFMQVKSFLDTEVVCIVANQKQEAKCVEDVVGKSSLTDPMKSEIKEYKHLNLFELEEKVLQLNGCMAVLNYHIGRTKAQHEQNGYFHLKNIIDIITGEEIDELDADLKF